MKKRMILISFCLITSQIFCVSETRSFLGVGVANAATGHTSLSGMDYASTSSWNPATITQLVGPVVSISGTYNIQERAYQIHDYISESGISSESGSYFYPEYFGLVVPVRKYNVFGGLSYRALLDQNEDLKEKVGNTNYDIQVTGGLKAVTFSLATDLLSFKQVSFERSLSLGANFNILTGVVDAERTYGSNYYDEEYRFSGNSLELGCFWKSSNYFSMSANAILPFREKASVSDKTTGNNIKRTRDFPAAYNLSFKASPYYDRHIYASVNYHPQSDTRIVIDDVEYDNYFSHDVWSTHFGLETNISRVVTARMGYCMISSYRSTYGADHTDPDKQKFYHSLTGGVSISGAFANRQQILDWRRTSLDLSLEIKDAGMIENSKNYVDYRERFYKLSIGLGYRL